MRLPSINWLKENFGLTTTFLGFTVDIITLTALVNSKVPPSIPFIDHPLGQKTQATILTFAGLTYLGFLREYWTQIRERRTYESSHTFLGFLTQDMILLLRYPFLLLPDIVLIGFSWIIFQNFWSIKSIAILASIFFLALVPLSTSIENLLEDQEWQEIWMKPNQADLNPYDLTRKLNTAKKISNQWIQRIEREIEKDKYVTNYDLAQMHSCARSVVRKAFRTYLKEYESEKQLILTEKKAKRDGIISVNLLVLCPRSSLDLKPWVKVSSRNW